MRFKRKNGELFWDVLTPIENGIVFAFVNWSLQSIASLQSLLQELDKWSEFDSVPIFAMNLENQQSALTINKLGVVSQGKGETCWIKDGIVTDWLMDYETEKENVFAYTMKIK